jgi:AraC-like DNA-binding protein
MPFEYFSPCADLSLYIHSYWTLKGGDEMYDVLYPDTCVDIVVNMGERFVTNQKGVVLETQHVYLGGALTEAMYEKIPEGVYLMGIRFLPGCFGYFYPPYPLGDMRDGCIAISEDHVPPLHFLAQDLISSLDTFFCNKLRVFHNPVKDAADKIIRSGGNIPLTEIAATCNKSMRQTERMFKQHIGLTPKQFCKIVKYTQVQKLLAAKAPAETLLDVALEAGYYDHAHLTKEFKKITRHTPSGKQPLP